MALGTTAARAADERAIVLDFTPTERAQIAIWIESADGTFLNTVGLTQAVSVRGIGNRPGATQMNSGFHWPYGRREGVLPIWAHRRASAPGAMQFPRIIFQHRPEGYASRTCEDSTRDAYYCLSFSADTTRKEPGCRHLRDAVQQRQGPHPAAEQTYAEPMTAGVDGGTSRQPRGHVAVPAAARLRELRRRLDGGRLHGRRQQLPGSARTPRLYAEQRARRDARDRRGHDGDAARRHRADRDVLGPADWPDGEYVAYLEINTEGDYNGIFNEHRLPDAGVERRGTRWAMSYGYPYRGQPSVVYASRSRSGRRRISRR